MQISSPISSRKSIPDLPSPTDPENDSPFPFKKKRPVIDKLMPQAGTPPRSPNNSRKVSSFTFFRRRTVYVAPFYFPLGTPMTPAEIGSNRKFVKEFFASHKDQVRQADFHRFIQDKFHMSSYVTNCIWDKCGVKCSDPMGMSDFHPFFENVFETTTDPKIRLFLILQDQKAKKIHRRNLEPLLQDVVSRHPGLQFLGSAPSFHDRYIETAIERIFYALCSEYDDGITLANLKHSNLIDCLHLLDIEEDINEIFDYFSYEHFYVIYCKFWELDTDHDFLIDADDLMKYSDGALIPAVCERVLEGHGEPRGAHNKKTMTYKEFIRFIISEEDKTTARSIRYWFRILNIDADGILSFFEIAQFWEQQAEKIKQISVDQFHYQNLTDQLKDMIQPANEQGFTLSELKRSGVAGLFFNMIFNLNKFARHEQRDPYRLEQKRENPHMSDWDRFAQIEYLRYAEEDVENSSA